MKRTSLFALLLSLFLLVSLASAQEAWEYALLRIDVDGYTFDAPDASASGADAADFYGDLTGEPLPEGSPAVSILSLIGSVGWELVSVDSTDGQTVTYYFKRVNGEGF